jgi:putative flippase GtrA
MQQSTSAPSHGWWFQNTLSFRPAAARRAFTAPAKPGLEAGRAGYQIRTVEIAAVYLDSNSGSHFRPLADSVRIYAPLLKFLAPSLTAFVVDTAFLVLIAATGSVLLAVVGARGISSGVSFLVNRNLVFRHGREQKATRTGARYFALVLTLLAANLALMALLDQLAVAALPAKLLVEAALLAVSYSVQQRFLFIPEHPAAGTAAGPAAGRVCAVSRTHIPDIATFVTAKQTASLVFSSAATRAGEEYTVYTGGTSDVMAGVVQGSLDGAQQQGTVTAGEYTAARGPGGRH